MRELILQRLTGSQPTDLASFGVFIDNRIPFAVTLEPPQTPLLPGTYICKRVQSPKFGETFEIFGLAGHDHVLFHWGNLPKDTLLCILVAEEFGPINGQDGIVVSRSDPNKGFNEFLKRLEGNDVFLLRVRKEGPLNED